MGQDVNLILLAHTMSLEALDKVRRDAAFAEIQSLMQISSEAISRMSALAIKAFGEEASEATEEINKALFKQALLKQLSSFTTLPNATAFSVISCLDPLLAESMFECEPDEFFLRPHRPSPIDPICMQLLNATVQNAIKTKQELFGTLIDGPSARIINAAEVWDERQRKLDEDSEEEMKQF